MKNIDKVADALICLQENAESDFEKELVEHFTSLLTEPPRVHVIDDLHQEFCGKIYTKNLQGRSGHYQSGELLHREVWKNFFGHIPAGHVIHHKDFCKEHNNIENLMLVTTKEHRRIHNLSAKEKTVLCEYCGKTFTCRNAGKVAKFCSEECRGKAKYQNKTSEMFEDRVCEICGKKFRTEKRSEATTCSKKCASQKRKLYFVPPTVKRICKRCGKEFETFESKPSSFCSEHCRNLTNYENSMEQRICQTCGKVFECSRFSSTRFCSIHCANTERFKDHVPVSQKVERQCIICGKKFLTNKHKHAKTCSVSCGVRLSWQERKNHSNNVSK